MERLSLARSVTLALPTALIIVAVLKTANFAAIAETESLMMQLASSVIMAIYTMAPQAIPVLPIAPK
jgi:hypothetical protein